MKDLFPGYYKKTEKEIRKIWEDGIILFDTNVLLNLYRYSDSTRETLLELIGKFSRQIYLPHQAALEYNRNRYEVIAEQEKAYKEFLEKISQIQKDLQSTSKPPFLTSKIDRDLNNVFEKVGAEVQDSIKKYSDYLKEDPIFDKISVLFDNKITDSFDQEEFLKICKEGEDRYKLKTPPGFEDEKGKEGDRKYGDLILWKQVIKLAKELKKDVILVTDERKIDWWWKLKDGRTMGARQELVEEMKKEADVDFHMYSSERFLSYGQTFLKEKINQHALDELQAMKNAELEKFKNSNIERDNLRNNMETFKIKNQIEDINEELNILQTSFSKQFNSDLSETNQNKDLLEKFLLREAYLIKEKKSLIEKLNSIGRYYLDIDVKSNNEFRSLRWNQYLDNDHNSDPSFP